MNSYEFFAILIPFLYLFLLFLIAYFVERKIRWKEYIQQNGLVYCLSLAIYCTAWTFYGSVGNASVNGLFFLSIYLGPTLFMPIWYYITRKVARIVKVNNITTFADFISIRYSNSSSLGMIITAMMLIGIIPYISLQIKAISESFHFLFHHESSLVISTLDHYVPFILILIIGIFIISFACVRMESNEHHTGIVASIAFESVIKIVAFLIGGIFISYFLFSEPSAIYKVISKVNLSSNYFTFSKTNNYFEWFALILLSAIAFTILPRQFQVSVIENQNEKQIKSAIWGVPLYLFLINLFVLPIALGGNLLLNAYELNPDYYILEIPLVFGFKVIGFIVFLGGFSAATSMIILETLAVANMLSNNLIIPLLLRLDQSRTTIPRKIVSKTLFLRRLSVAIILILTLLYYNILSPYYSLVSIGLISFVFIAQFFPSFIAAIYWKNATYQAVKYSICVGFIVWGYTLILPSIIDNFSFGRNVSSYGLFGLHILKPSALFGLEDLSPVVHSFFWTMFFNISTFISVSLLTKPSNYEKQQAYLYNQVFQIEEIEESNVLWKETAIMSDIQDLLERFLGKTKTQLALNSFSQRFKVNLQEGPNSDPRLVPFAERLLSKIVGTTSARILLETVIKEKEIKMNEMMDILDESKEVISLNRELNKRTNDLAKAKTELEKINNRLILHDQTKDDFLATVSHELKSPLTSISALSEILFENEDLSMEEITKFSQIINKESGRITRLINQLLDLEKYSSGTQKLHLSIVNIPEFFIDVQDILTSELMEKKIILDIQIDSNVNEFIFDRDKMIQVLINLLSNAIKFNPEEKPIIVKSAIRDKDLVMEVEDCGKGIEDGYHEVIFEKFYQARNQALKKPKGSGLGLAICKKIVELHQGKIYVKSSNSNGSIFAVEIPKFEV